MVVEGVGVPEIGTAADEIAVLLRLVGVDGLDDVVAVGLGEVILLVPDVICGRGHGSGLFLDALVVGVVGHRDDGVRQVAGLVVLRRLVLEVPGGRDASPVGVLDDLLVAVGVEHVRRSSGGGGAVDDLVRRVVGRRGPRAALVVEQAVAAGIERERVPVGDRSGAVLAGELVRLVVQPRHAAGVGFDDRRAVSGGIVPVGVAGDRRGGLMPMFASRVNSLALS